MSFQQNSNDEKEFSFDYKPGLSPAKLIATADPPSRHSTTFQQTFDKRPPLPSFFYTERRYSCIIRCTNSISFAKLTDRS